MANTELIFSRVFKLHYLPKLTTQELVDELLKREGVTDCVVAGDSRCWITNEGNIHYQVYAPATILVVKKE